ncbi:patatin-like phospholipase domain-containing protein 4 isoform X2 [Palaemon carinicauda]|uniref:patatin-like phospholipase domain-containing protein 4 isoform X2 n=1 Tax=Palaemon carinicauda TaxID=392227 RepID=UPI0035B68E11
MSLSSVVRLSRPFFKTGLKYGIVNLNRTGPLQIVSNEMRPRFFSVSRVFCKDWVEVTFETLDGSYTVKGKEGDNLLDVVINNDVDLDGFGACEGTLSCSTCHLIFEKEDFDKIEDPCTDEELDMLDLAYGLSDTTLNMSLAGCGFLGVYLMGALDCLKRCSPRFVQKAQVFGVSAGSLLGASVVCNVPLDGIKFGFLRIAAEAQNWAMGPFNPRFNFEKYLCKGLESLPPDAHIRASGRLYISVTRVRDMKNVIISKWDTRDDLIQTLRASCFILGYSGMKPPLVNGERYIDGGYSNTNKSFSLEGKVISISPFCGEADICPSEDQGVGKLKFSNLPIDVSFSNAVRFYRTLMPPPPHILNEYYSFGYFDAYRYLKKQKALMHGI